VLDILLAPIKLALAIIAHPVVFSGGVVVGILFGYKIKAWLVARAAQLEAAAKTVVH
jgi:hypothetical protein